MYKLKTIDVWDTLLRRDCHPECIKLATAQHLLLGWANQLKPEFSDVWLLYRARVEAERTLADQAIAGGKDDEYEITQVLTRWTNVVFSGAVPLAMPMHLAEFELNVEISRSYADSEISDYLRFYESEKTMFLSDFYMSAEMLSRLLASKGFDALVSEGISSCDVGLNKRSGRIFRYVHELHDVSPNQHVHIGDNEWSDVASPRALGVNALHYLPEQAHPERLARERLFSSRDALFEHIRVECSTLAEDSSRALSAKQGVALTLGVQAAPLFIGFSLWIAEQAIHQELDKLCFLSQEGEFFHKVFCALFPDGQLSGHNLPPATIIAVSRVSTLAPSLTDGSIQELSRIRSLLKVHSFSCLFATLGLDIGKFSLMLDAVGLKETDTFSDPENSLELRRLFETPAFAENLKNALESKAELLQIYLSQSGLKGGGRIGVVDIGGLGTIQDNIALLIPDAHFSGMYLGLRTLISAQPLNVSKAAYGPNENTAREISTLFANFDAIEFLCRSPLGSVVGYALEGGRAVPQWQADLEENGAYDEFVGAFQKGVLLAARKWQSYLARYVVSSNELREMGLRVWDMLCKAPPEELLDVYLRTPQRDIFGSGDRFERKQYPSFGTIRLSPILAWRRRQLVEFTRRVRGAEAIDNSEDIGSVHRSVLLLVLRAAHLVKRAALKARIAKRRGNA